VAEQKKKEGKKKPDVLGEKELREMLQRVQADFENYRKRVEKEKEQFAATASSLIIKQLLPVVDNFEAALKNKSSNAEFAKGIEMIYAQLFSVLESAGLKPIEAEGNQFDPYLHEALMQEESDKGDGIVIEEFQKGYMIGDTVVRHSKVKVSKMRKKEVQE